MAINILQRANIFELEVDAIINPVNCYGVSGAGLALKFKQKYPANFEAYRAACLRAEIVPGTLLVTATSKKTPRFVVNFPTKRHWTEDSILADIEVGLASLLGKVSEYDIRSVALPALGCGLGGLSWNEVLPLVEVFASKAGIPVYVIAPQ